MNATGTHRPATQSTERWTASRIFRAALAITLGVLTALVVAFALFYLVLGGTNRVVLESDGVVEEVSSQATETVNAVSVRPDRS
jgi:multisubunit Na+/H+ antiporter MnhC subunit